MQTAELKELEKVAIRAVTLAERIILAHFDSNLAVEWKPDNTPVTIADKGAEEVLRQVFAQETPEFGVIGEEFGIENPDAECKWIFDPIDGTKSFIRGVPLFGTLIGLYKKNEPLVSIVNLPAQKKRLHAVKNGGAFLGETRVQVSDVAKMDKSLVLSGTVNTFDDRGLSAEFEKYRRASALYRGWGDCYGYYLVATGRAEAMVDPIVSLWDIAAFPLLLSEAGGSFSLLNGETDLFDDGGKPLHSIYEGYSAVATNGKVHKAVLDSFAKVN